MKLLKFYHAEQIVFHNATQTAPALTCRTATDRQLRHPSMRTCRYNPNPLLKLIDKIPAARVRAMQEALITAREGLL